LKKLYANPNRLADQYASGIQRLKTLHLNLIESIRDDLKIKVPPQLLAAFHQRSVAGKPVTVVTKLIPFQMQPRILCGRPDIGPRGPMAPRGLMGPRPPVIPDPFQQGREVRKRMQDARKNARGPIGRIGP